MATSLVDFGVGGIFTTILHPTGYAKTLIQLGHEPLQPTLCKRFIVTGKDVYCYPNILKYCGHIWTTDGFLGMYKGLVPRLLGGYCGNIIYASVLKELKKGEEPANDDDEAASQDMVKLLLVEMSQETCAKIVAVVASQPFHVLMIRQMAQFVGGEKQYDGLFGGMMEIYRTDGIRGFFAGVIPRLIGEMIFIWLGKIISSLISKYVVESKDAQSYVGSVCNFLTSMVTYRFTLISNIMAVSGTDLVLANPPNMKPYSTWLDCYSHLQSLNDFKRGSSTFFRYTKSGTTMYTAGLRRSFAY